MTDRPTASTITDDQLDALYAERDQLASRVADWKESTRGATRLNNELRAGRDRLEEELVTARSTLDRVRKAGRRVTSALIAVESRLTQPYPDDPRWTPWTRFVGPALKELRAALNSTEQPAEVTP